MVRARKEKSAREQSAALRLELLRLKVARERERLLADQRRARDGDAQDVAPLTALRRAVNAYETADETQALELKLLNLQRSRAGLWPLTQLPDEGD